MPPLAWVAILSFAAGALTFQLQMWSDIRDRIDDDEET